MPRFERKGVFFEVERLGVALETAELRPNRTPVVSRTRYPNVAAAENAYDAVVAKRLARKYVPAGESQLLVAAPPPGAGSALMLEELFAEASPGFVEEVLACRDDKKLTALAPAWIERPEMRRALLDYIDDGCDRPGHKGLVKHLFKAAEARGDDELMAHFMVAFDRLVRRFPVKSTATRFVADPTVNEHVAPKMQVPDRFSRATRRYLRRRAFRYFRAIGRADRARYRAGMLRALPLYEDRHLDTAAKLLDAWSLMHALYAWSPVLDRDRRGVRVVKGRSLAELTPEPYFKDAWLGVLPDLLDLLVSARGRTVRRWTLAWLDRHYRAELDGLGADRLLPMLRSADDEVVAFGSRRLGTAKGLETLPVDAWLSLLKLENLEVIPVVVAAFEKHVSSRRLTLAQTVALAQARVAPVAELGLRWAREKTPAAADVVEVTRSPVESVRRDGAEWVIALSSGKPGHALVLRELFDSRFADVRALAAAHVDAAKTPDVALWFALLESPFDDVRALVVRHAAAWQGAVGASELEHLAASVILAVHRGSAAKPAMLRQIAEHAATDADRFMPVLAVALRSVRPRERVSALAAITRATVANPELRGAIGRYLPELAISEQVAQ